MKTWVVVANSSFAEILSVEGREIKSIQRIDNPAGRQRSGEILQDRPGRGFESSSGGAMGHGRHAYGTAVDAHVHEQQMFAHRIGDLLKKALLEHKFDRLDLICPPQFLGELRQVLSDKVKQAIHKEVNKEIPSALSEGDRIEQVRKFLELPRPASVK